MFFQEKSKKLHLNILKNTTRFDIIMKNRYTAAKYGCTGGIFVCKNAVRLYFPTGKAGTIDLRQNIAERLYIDIIFRREK